MKNSSEPITKKSMRPSVDIWTAQCGECLKWRIIQTQEEYEEIRAKLIEDPFVCSKKLYSSCDDPADIEYDSSRAWLMDKPNLPKTPSGFKREIKVRNDFTKTDCYYTTPTGKLMRTITEVGKFLDENPEYKKGVDGSHFSFAVPRIVEETVPSSKRRKNV